MPDVLPNKYYNYLEECVETLSLMEGSHTAGTNPMYKEEKEWRNIQQEEEKKLTRHTHVLP